MLPESSDVNPYLQQEVLSASPLRLRWMLIQRSVELCGLVEQLWSSGQDDASGQWLLSVREILGELLDGIQDANNPLSKPLTDFYLYLLQLAFEVDKNRDRQQLRVLRELLEFESETWRIVVEKAGSESAAHLPAAHLPLGPLFPEVGQASHPQAFHTQAYESLPGGFSLEV